MTRASDSTASTVLVLESAVLGSRSRILVDPYPGPETLDILMCVCNFGHCLAMFEYFVGAVGPHMPV
jgi:hypothetical protein